MGDEILDSNPVYQIKLPANAWPSRAPDDSPPLTGQTRDICRGSLRLILDSGDHLEAEDSIKVGLDAGPEDGDVMLNGTVRWLKSQNGGKWEVEAGINLSGNDLAKWVMFLSRMEASGRCRIKD